MLRYLLYLIVYIPLQIITYVITPLLPMFAINRSGWSNNKEYEEIAPRLPPWLSWFDTPDNSLLGDNNWFNNHKNNYLSKVMWLYRNSLYGFKWSVLAAPMTSKVIRYGAESLDYHTAKYGWQYLKMNSYWQFKYVKPFMNKIIVLNIGWY